MAVFLVSPVLAQAPQLNLGLEYVDYTGLANTDIRMVIAKIIRAALGLIGLVAVALTIYGGYMYMTSEGNEEKITTAKRILKNMVIGLAIILSALGIVQFVIRAILNEYAEKYGQAEMPAGYTEEFVIGGYLGSVIESHYPKRNAPWPGEPPIPRNTQIFVTFKQKIKPETLILDSNKDGVFGNIKDNLSDQLNSDNIKIYATADKEAGALGMKPETEADDVYAYLSQDGRTVIFKPKNYLGDPLKEINYTVDLKNGVKLLDGALAFTGLGGHYSWQFTVSPNVDLIPPQVESIIPLPSPNKYPRNIIVQINFNEAINPISASGIFKTEGPSFSNITVTTTANPNQLVAGEYKISNQYRTIEFTTDDQCGTNPCGQPIFCLPANENLAATVKSATVDANNPPQAQITANLYDGIVDAAGNSLNGGGEMGKNKKSDYQTLIGQPDDNFWWQFSTSAALDTTAPRISDIEPPIQAEQVTPSAPLSISFNKPMSIGTFRHIILKTNKDFNVWYSSQGLNYDAAGKVVTSTVEIVRTTAELVHGPFWQTTSTLDKIGGVYYPFVSSAVSDIYQNCFYPAVADFDGSACQELKETGDPNCYNNTISPVKTFCGIGETCPFSPEPKP